MHSGVSANSGTINNILTGWKLFKDQSARISVHSDCKNVSAPSGYDVFVPTKTLDEWNAFKSVSTTIGVRLNECIDSNLPTLTVNRTPAGGSAGTAYSVMWTPTQATQVTLECTGARTIQQIQMSNTGGISIGTYSTSWSGTTNCIWRAINSYGTATVNESYTVTVSPYVWRAFNVGTCSVACGGGTQNRNIVCVQRNNGVPVADSNCTDPKPAATASCNTQLCAYSWQVTGASACSVSCGGGTQTRTIQCVGYEGVVNDSFCTGAKPAAVVSCNTQACPFYGCTPNTTIDWDGNRIICGANGQPTTFWRPGNPAYAMFGNPLIVNSGCQGAIVQPYIPDYNQCWYVYEYIAPYWAYVNFACNNTTCIMRSQFNIGTQDGYSSMPYIGTR